jgi:hypothetical protein
MKILVTVLVLVTALNTHAVSQTPDSLSKGLLVMFDP